MSIFSPVLDITQYYLPLSTSEVFGSEAETALEIGSGDGDFLIETAKRRTNWNSIGIEIKTKRFKKAVKRAEREKVRNVRLLLMDAKIAVEEVFSPNTFGEVYINFPDPWPKDRHKKHRIINPKFLRKLSKIMKPEAALEIASDHEEYVFHILATLNEAGLFRGVFRSPGYVNSLPDRPMTKYEREFREQGKEIYYLRFVKVCK